MVAKRQGAQNARAAKKVKLDPVSVKVKEVVDALSRDDCEIAGPPSYLEGILAAFPLAMGLGAAKDERHAYQEQVGDIVLEVLKATEQKFQVGVKAAKEEHSASEGVKSSKETAVTDTQRALEEQRNVETEAHANLLSSSEALTQATTKLEESTAEVESFDTIQLAKAKERAEFSSALETEFETLKTGACEDAKEKKSLLARVGFVLKKLGVDQGLCSAAPPAFTKAPDARGPFDITVVEQVETALKARVDSLGAELDNGETLKAAKVTEQVTAQELLNTAQAKVAENQGIVREAEAKTKEFESALEQAKASLKEQEAIVADFDIKAFYAQTNVDNFLDAIQALEFLRDRVSTVPEAEAEKISFMETSVAMDESAQANLVV